MGWRVLRVLGRGVVGARDDAAVYLGSSVRLLRVVAWLGRCWGPVSA